MQLELLGCTKSYGLWITDRMKANLVGGTNYDPNMSAPTLRIAVENFLTRTARERNAGIYSIVSLRDKVRVCRIQRDASKLTEKTYSDLDFLIDVVTIVREFAGSNWYPPKMALRSLTAINHFTSIQFPRTRFLFDQAKCWVELPRCILTLPYRPNQRDKGCASADHPVHEKTPIAQFVSQLKRSLSPHLSEGYPDIDFAAEITGTSVRTLQRNLSRAGLTYTKIVEHTRFEVASQMLTDPATKIIDIAYTVGYQDPSHFSRAFRRIAGMSPREFRLNLSLNRNHLLANKTSLSDK